MSKFKVCFTILVFNLSAAIGFAQPSWERIAGQPFSGKLNVLDEKTILLWRSDQSQVRLGLSDDGGLTWSVVEPPTSLGGQAKINWARRSSLTDLELYGAVEQFVPPVNYYYYSTVWHSQDKGKTFNSSGSSGLGSYFLIDETHGGTLLGICDPRDYSAEWGAKDAFRLGGPSINLNEFITGFDQRNRVALAIRKRELWRSEDSCKSWLAVPSMSFDIKSFPVVRSITASIWMLASDAEVKKSVDSGKTWFKFYEAPARITSLQFRDSIGIMGLQSQDYLLVSTDSGNNWFAAPTDGVTDIRKVWIPSDSVGYAEGSAVIRTSTVWSRASVILHAPRFIDLGSQSAGSVAETKVNLYNLGTSDLLISGVNTDDPSLEVGLDRSTVAPGDSATLSIKFTATVLPQNVASINLSTNSPSKDEVITVYARVQKLGVPSSKRSYIGSFVSSQSNGTIFQPSRSGECQFIVRDVLGRDVKSQSQEVEMNESVQLLPPGLLSRGFYSIEVSFGGEVQFEKVIVQ